MNKMYKLYKLIKKEIFKSKKTYLLLSIIMLLGFIFGTLFITILNNTDKNLIVKSITNFFNNIKESNINTIGILKNSLLSNILFIVLIFILSISIIGIPFIIIICFYKSFILGFSISSIILTYKLSGSLLALVYIFPHVIIYLFLMLYVSLYGIFISLSMYKVIFSKKEINLKLYIKRFILICIISILISVLLSLFEAFVTPYLLSNFKFLIK